MEIKIQCGCGTKYKFDVEPVNGRMPMAIVCPSCGSSGLTDANQQIAQRYPQAAPAMPPQRNLPLLPARLTMPIVRCWNGRPFSSRNMPPCSS